MVELLRRENILGYTWNTNFNTFKGERNKARVDNSKGLAAKIYFENSYQLIAHC